LYSIDSLMVKEDAVKLMDLSIHCIYASSHKTHLSLYVCFLFDHQLLRLFYMLYEMRTLLFTDPCLSEYSNDYFYELTFVSPNI
jgi:hypothetical protein